MTKKLRELAISVSKNAYSPYSKVCVGAAIETENGELYSGCNIENASFGGTVCAERVAIWKAISEGHQKIKSIYIYTDAGWPPCGFCRQVLSEFADENCQVIIGSKIDTQEKIISLGGLFPLAFGPKQLDD